MCEAFIREVCVKRSYGVCDGSEGLLLKARYAFHNCGSVYFLVSDIKSGRMVH